MWLKRWTFAILLLAVSVPATAEIVTREVGYEANGTQMVGYLAFDDAIAGERPGVLVVHEWWGLNEYARERARQLAALGYTAFAVDMYGAGRQAQHPEEAAGFAQQVAERWDEAKARFSAALEVLQAHEATDADRVAAIGYCFGGAVVLNMARAGLDLDGVVSFHGSLAGETDARPGEVEARILVLHGADDPFVPRDEVDSFHEEMKAAGVDYRLVEYPGVVHSFTNPDATRYGEMFDLPLAYDAHADEASWAEMQGFFDGIFARD